MANIDIANPGPDRDRLITALEDLVQYNLGELLDVSTGGVANGYILLYNSSNTTWVAAEIPQQVLDLDDLADVSIVSPSNGHLLYFNASEGNWQVTAPPPTINELSDVGNVDAASAANGQFLSWSNATSEWVNAWPVPNGDKGDITVSANGATWTIDTNAVSLAKIQTIATDTLLGRDTASTGNVEQISVSGGIEFTGSGGIRTSAFTGDVTKTAGGTVTTIAANSVTNAKMTNVATQTFKGRNTAGTGSPEDLSVSTVRTMLSIGNVDNTSDANKPVSSATQTALDLKANLNSPALSGTPTAPTVANNNNSNTIATTAYVDAMVAGAGAGGSISDGDKGDITVSANGATWTIDTNAVSLAKIQTIATDTLLGRDTASTGNVEQIGVSGGIEFNGTGNLQIGAFTAGDVIKTAGSTTLTIDANKVLNTMLRDSAGLSVIGRSANTTGDPADITAASDSTVLRRTSNTLNFGTVTTAMVDNDAITYAKMQNVSATSRVLGRKTASAGDTEELTYSEVLDFVGSATRGDILYRGATTWQRLPKGTSGYVLSMGADDPQWILPSSGGGANVQVFDSSSTWNKPASIDPNSMVIVQLWGGGGSGGKRAGAGSGGAGGGGGAYRELRFRAGDLSNTVSVTIGAGGTAVSANNSDGNAGGTTSFGTFGSAYGGGGGGKGATNITTIGGSGGHWVGTGATGSANNQTVTPVELSIAPAANGNVSSSVRPVVSATGITYYYEGMPGLFFYDAGSCCSPASNGYVVAIDTMYVGAGGGAGGNLITAIRKGANSMYGGAGGGFGNSSVSGAGGTSVSGGNGGAGGASGTAGAVPGGGGGGSSTGNSGAGGSGRCVVTVITAS